MEKEPDYLLRNPIEAKEMGKKGRIKIIKEFDDKLVFDRIKEGYQRLIEVGGKSIKRSKKLQSRICPSS